MKRLNRIKLVRAHYIPKELQPGVLYVSEEFDAAVHLCACGCRSKVSTPLGSTEWTFEESVGGPSLRPSVGNHQLPCRSHYWIHEGRVVWSGEWSLEQVAAGRQREEERRCDYYDALDRARGGVLRRLWLRIKSFFE